MSQDNNILYLMPSAPMAQAVGKCLKKMGLSYPIFNAVREKALELAREYLPKGTKVIVSYGETATRIRQQTEAYVVEVQYNGLDLIRSIKKASKHHSKIAVVGFAKFIYSAKQIQDLINLPIRVEQIHSSVEAAPVVARLGKEGFTAFIGGTVVGAALAAGYEGIYIEVDTQAILDAINEANRMLRIQQEKDARLGTTVTILNSVSEGLIGIDKDGFVTEMNTVAMQFFGEYMRGEQSRHYREMLGKIDFIENTLRQGVEWLGETVTISGNMYSVNCKPILVDNDIIGAVVTFQEPMQIQALEQKIRKARRHEGRSAKNTFADIIGDSPAITKVKEQALTFASVDSAVLIYGETGTGKELMAQSIHNASGRADAPFVAINCAALPENLLESELFGYVKGAFTGATASGKMGLFEIANSATIFQDEIGETNLPLQSRLMRALQEKEIWRIGDTKTTRVDIRVIAATNRDLSAMVAAGTFREDLYYRLSVLVVNIPPLRDRMGDMRPLSDRIVQEKGAALNRKIKPLHDDAVQLLCSLGWPGNVRQLSNVIERAIVMSRGNRITTAILKESLDSCSWFGNTLAKSRAPQPESAPLPPAYIGTVTDEMILAQLANHNGSKKQTAAALGMSSTTLWRRLKQMAQH